ncbi:hypothetical protein [Thiolinea disciformis]|uniref:hypothetical protein n=1 Tax=Thiolinea disciformis TaxID=125614 RepID=UPI00035EA616|nr:hypothetical protein [Thiolinea disciformis]
MNEFTLEEAVKLIYQHVVLRKNIEAPEQKPNLSSIGHICGVLTLNDQIEVVVKFQDAIQQFTKTEFAAQLVMLIES